MISDFIEIGVGFFVLYTLYHAFAYSPIGDYAHLPKFTPNEIWDWLQRNL